MWAEFIDFATKKKLDQTRRKNTRQNIWFWGRFIDERSLETLWKWTEMSAEILNWIKPDMDIAQSL